MGKKVLIFLMAAILLLSLPAMPAEAATTEGYEVGYAKVDINPYWHAWANWSKNRKDSSGNALPDAGTYPRQDFYDSYDLMPLPMAGYGNNETRLSRPKLMDDNGSGKGASTQNVTKAKTSDSATEETTLKASSFYSYVYANNPDYQDVHLSNNRYTQTFAEKLFGGTNTQAYQNYVASAGIQTAEDWGENDGDGVWASCVLIKDPQTEGYLMLISVDVISLGTSLTGLIKDSILAKSEVQALGLTADRILINSNHTHGSVDTGGEYGETDTSTTYTLARNTFNDDVTFTGKQLYWYLNFYKNYLRSKLAEAAVQAIKDLEPALTMEKGAIDAGVQTGHHMNGVRHSVQTYNGVSVGKSPITYVRGSSFNNYMRSTSTYDDHTAGKGFTASKPVSESNDMLQVLQFTFKNKEPIAMVNFRAHSTANNKEAAKALHYNISADWVSPLRYEVEQAGYRFSLLYGNSGNLGTGVSSDTNSLIPYNQAYYSTADGFWVLPATHYGRGIAQSALALLGEVAEENNSILHQMQRVPMGKLLLQKTDYLSKRQEFSPLAYAAAMQFHLDGAPPAGGRYTIADGETVTYTDSSKTHKVTLKAGEGGTFIIASKYHANSILARYGVTTKTKLELNTIRLGDKVAMYSTPIEAADRYFTNTITKTTDIVANASKYNDWWNLNEEGAWGVPFDLSLTNGASGYITNELAYDYNKDYTGDEYIVATGSYESQNSNHNRGEGEKMVAVLNGMLRNMEPKTAYCEECKSNQTWQPLQSTSIVSGKLPGGHYFLAGNYAINSQTAIATGQQVCLDLNGFTYSAEASSADSRAFTVAGVLNVMDHSSEKNGILQGMGKKNDSAYSYGTVYVEAGGTMNLYSGNITTLKQTNYDIKYGGVIGVIGTFRMYGGAVCGGVATSAGGNIFINGGTVTLSGGEISGGTAPSGGNIYLSKGSLTISGGSITGGAATANGGNIYAASGTTLTVTGGEIYGGRAEKGTASTMGGNVYTNGTFTMEGGSITGGYAYYGGNVQVQNNTASFTMRGGEIYGGSAGYKTDVSDLCTGQSSKETGYSLFRMEGGYVGIVYIQGQVVLAGTTEGTTPVRVVVKAPGERLTVEGAYTGNIHLVLNDSNYLNLPVGSQVGLASKADISGATIALLDYPDMQLKVSGSNLVLGLKPVAAVGGKDYDTVASAVAAYNTAGGWLVVKKADLELSGLTRDLMLDLNGYPVAKVDTGRYKLICKDSATDDFSSPTADSYGSIPAGTAYETEDGYLAVTQGGQVSFHRYALTVANVNLRPAKTGIYYGCLFQGDELVKAQVAEFGVAMSLKNGMTSQNWIDSITQDTENKTHISYDGSRWTVGDAQSNGVIVRNILKQDLSDRKNQSRGESKVHGVNYVQLKDGQWLFGNTESYSIRDIVETVNETFDSFPAELLDLYRAYEPVMCLWDTDRIAAAAK